jgi:hypothetical protein
VNTSDRRAMRATITVAISTTRRLQDDESWALLIACKFAGDIEPNTSGGE